MKTLETKMVYFLIVLQLVFIGLQFWKAPFANWWVALLPLIITTGSVGLLFILSTFINDEHF